MSLKNYIFASINTKATTTLHNRHQRHNHQQHVTSGAASGRPPPYISPRPTPTVIDEEELPDVEQRRQRERISSIISEIVEHPKQHTSTNWVKKMWKFVSVEPVMICWLLPSCLLYIAVENLALEKSCRVNFGYDDIICDNMIDKSINNINCVNVRKEDAYQNDSILAAMNLDKFENGINATSANETVAVINDTLDNHLINITESLNQLKIDVCHAEIDSQVLDSALNVYTSPFDSIFGIIMILFAGGWSDKKGTRKPCMLLPLIGELLSLLVLLTASIFMKQLPLEFNSIGSKLFPAIFGGSNLMLMGVYSYLTEITPEKDRTFRFGIFAIIVPLIPIISIPFSGILFQKLRYINLVLMCIPINILGILYIIFVLREVKPRSLNEQQPVNEIGIDNLTFDMADLEHKPRRSRIHSRVALNADEFKTKIKKNFLVEFFNPVVAVDCIRVVLKKRPFNGRRIVALLLVMYLLAIGPAFGEEPNEYNFTRITLNWDGLKYSPFATYGNAVSLLGTAIMVGGLSKIFHLSDPLVGFLGTFTSGISRIVYSTATTSTMMYVARTLDMFIGVRGLTIKSTISTFVESVELGRIFSIIGIIEAFGKFIFVSIYSIIYKNTLESFPSAFYLCSFVCLFATASLFVVLYFIVRNKKTRDALMKIQEQNGNNGTSAEATVATIGVNGNGNSSIMTPTNVDNVHI